MIATVCQIIDTKSAFILQHVSTIIGTRLYPIAIANGTIGSENHSQAAVAEGLQDWGEF